MNKIQEAYEQGLRIRRKGWEDMWIKKHSEGKSIDELRIIRDDGWPWEIHPEDKHLFKEQHDIKSQIQEHLNKIQSLLNQL